MAKTEKGPRAVPQTIKPAPQGAKTTGETVCVACKLPNGMILRGFVRDVRQENVLGGGVRDVPFHREDGRRVTLYGNARPKGGSFRTRVVAGYALTQGVPKDLWDQWAEANAESGFIVNHLVFAEDNVEHAAQRAREGRAIRSGLEPLNPQIENEPRVPRPANPDVGVLRMEDEKMKAEQFETVDEEMA